MDRLIKNGVFVNAYRAVTGELWIRDGKIYRFHPSLKPQQEVEVFDASGYVIFPGLINPNFDSITGDTSFAAYMDTVKEEVKRGITTYIARIAVDSSVNLAKRIAREIANHHNSPIDFACRLQIPCRIVNRNVIRTVKKMGIHQLEISVERPQDLTRIDWAEIAPFLRNGGMNVGVVPQAGVSWREDDALETTERFLRISALHGLKTFVYISTEKQLKLFEKRREICAFPPDAGVFGCLDPELIPQWERDYRQKELAACELWVKEGRFFAHRHIPHSDIVKLTSTNIAKWYGLYPQKGSLSPGSDADFIFVREDCVLTDDGLEAKLKIGNRIHPERIMSKGEWIFADSAFRLHTGMGRRLTQRARNYFVLV
ncbi:hypothetical protein BSNK01_13680 [Bacillaceae bacterium]